MAKRLGFESSLNELKLSFPSLLNMSLKFLCFSRQIFKSDLLRYNLYTIKWTILVHSSVCFDKHVSCVTISIIKNSSISLKSSLMIFHSYSLPAPHPVSIEATDLFSISVMLLTPECHKNGVIVYTAFWIRILSHSITHCIVYQ